MMLYDIFHPDFSMDRSTTLPGRAPRGSVAVNANWDGHVFVARRGKWIDGRRTAGGKFVAADEIVTGDRVEASDGDAGLVVRTLAGKKCEVAWSSGVRTIIQLCDIKRREA